MFKWNSPNNTFHISLIKLLSHAPYQNYYLCFCCQCELYISKCKKNVKNWFTILCKIMHIMLDFNSEVINIVCSVNTSLIKNDLFHQTSAYFYIMTVSHVYALLHIPIRYQWDFRYLFLIIKLNNFFFQILLQDKYNIVVLTVNIECMWLSSKRLERLAKACISLISKTLKFYIYRQYTNIVYLSKGFIYYLLFLMTLYAY